MGLPVVSKLQTDAEICKTEIRPTETVTNRQKYFLYKVMTNRITTYYILKNNDFNLCLPKMIFFVAVPKSEKIKINFFV